MTVFVGLLFFLLIGVLGLVVWWQHATGKCNLVSLRNIALLGFVIFQIGSAGAHLVGERFDRFPVDDPAGTGMLMFVYACVFLVIAFVTYDRGWLVRGVSRGMAVGKGSAGSSFLISMAVVFTCVAVALRFGVAIPIVSVLASMLGVGFASVACGLVGWVWARQLLNPMVIMVVVLIVGANVFAMMWGQFGRRTLVAVFGAMLWGMYFSHWRHLPFKAMAFRIVIIGAAPLIFVALFTSARGSARATGAFDAVSHLQAMRTGDVKEGITLLFEGQGTGLITLWCLENFPENFESRPLFTVMYAVGVSVPRALWEDKPSPLSTQTATYARLRGVDRGKVLLPAGILGNAAAEGGWYALIIYAALSGLFLRFFDELLRTSPGSPFVVLPVGAQLGQALGLARGETAVFANTYVLTFIGVWIAMVTIARVLEACGMSRVVEHGSVDSELLEGDYEQYADDARDDNMGDA